ncbi:hypothetical protein PAXRUDRAFT_834542 [Paxillus rubicundulus Ve08.2h10]|uniref:Uncharacterized protein n=1 Tax=Paxillus rubicundulus Ve08.2h10 TaxID=930991 RepID=A0A0D0D4F3_9AGAM|nr:hypothetical protein PAXRUDRAFT_834542 [Paxillus rubicundulus Ve08.2h10]
MGDFATVMLLDDLSDVAPGVGLGGANVLCNEEYAKSVPQVHTATYSKRATLRYRGVIPQIEMEVCGAALIVKPHREIHAFPTTAMVLKVYNLQVCS